MVKKDLLTRNLERINVEQKPNFHKLLDEFLENDRKSLISTLSIDDQKKDILTKIFVLLNRANHKRTKRSTSPLTAMYGNKFYKLYELLDYDMKDLQLISQDELFQSITGMQAGK